MAARLRLKLPPWAFLLVLAALVAALLFWMDSYRHRFVRSNADLIGLLPSKDTTQIFADFALIRRAGMMRLLAGARPAEEKDYAVFVRQTGFDYTRDVDALAAAIKDDQIFFAARGRFDWDKLQSYVTGHGGKCLPGGYCSIETSRPGRFASMRPVQPDVIALALSPDRSAVQSLHPPEYRRDQPLPGDPVWIKISPALLQNPVDIPVPLRIFAISLQSARLVIVSLDPAEGDAQAAFEIRLDAVCPNKVTADTIRNQLELQTKLLKLELARERQQPNPADLTGLLTAGSFQVVNRHVIGTWPVRNELLKTLQ
jgi:hypothetical protein